MTWVQRIRGTYVHPAYGVPVGFDRPIYVPVDVITSDDFTGTGALNTGQTNAAHGGTPMPWRAVTDNGWTRDQGTARMHATDYNARLQINDLPQDISVQFTMVEMPTGGQSAVLSVRAYWNTANPRIYFRFFSTGRIRVEDRTATDNKVIAESGLGAVGPGDVVQVVAVGGRVQVIVNDLEQAVADTTITGGGAMFFSSYAATTYRIDDLIVGAPK